MLIVLDSRPLDGMLFQSLAPLTQKKLLRKSSLARGTFKGKNNCWWRVFGSLLCCSVNSLLCSLFQNPRRNLNISIASPRCRLSSRVVRPSCLILPRYEPYKKWRKIFLRTEKLQLLWADFRYSGIQLYRVVCTRLKRWPLIRKMSARMLDGMKRCIKKDEMK